MSLHLLHLLHYLMDLDEVLYNSNYWKLLREFYLGLHRRIILPTLRKAQIEVADFLFVFQKGLFYLFKIDKVTSIVATDCGALAFVAGKSAVQTSARRLTVLMRLVPVLGASGK
jgi:hypothetical protein